MLLASQIAHVHIITSYVGLLPCASTIRRAATVIIIAAAKGEAQQIIKGCGARASFMAHPLYIHTYMYILKLCIR
jgi:hypothetical protein